MRPAENEQRGVAMCVETALASGIRSAGLDRRLSWAAYVDLRQAAA